MIPTKEPGVLSLAAIRRPKEEGRVEYLFHEREQIFTLPQAAKTTEGFAARLQESFEKKAPVKVLLNARLGLIREVGIPTPQEVDEFKRLRVPLEKPDRTLPIDVASIDPTKFNLVDYYLKRRTFRLCTRVVPNYMKAKEIFDFCAKQSCHLGGPYDISPCIPFQYVRDGCYARAHKMRWIITTKYRYCCEKVFSFANQGYDRLAVRANKWGGCCVSWWYHVAPLLRVTLKFRNWSLTLAIVIDPGMFDKPVLLSSWLAAQENKGCDPNAKVSMYSIQPGAAYWPTNYAGTTFGTDPSYALTDATLNAYHSLTTCP